MTASTKILIPPSDELRAEILALKAHIQTRRPATLECALPVLMSIFVHREDQLRRIAGELFAPLNMGEVRPTSVRCFAQDALAFCVRDFNTERAATPDNLKMLYLVLDNALRGELNFLAPEPTPPVPVVPRRFSRAWWKTTAANVKNNFVRSFGVASCVGEKGGVGVIVHAAHSPAPCPSVIVNQVENAS